ncbi:hypothetical protein B0H14DRAFT_2632364 [Mycena olivaceomarginata]|nr:hypothetical protein B0H14DRAFT_2632364 [Mycena olivaceomarginata]
MPSVAQRRETANQRYLRVPIIVLREVLELEKLTVPALAYCSESVSEARKAGVNLTGQIMECKWNVICVDPEHLREKAWRQIPAADKFRANLVYGCVDEAHLMREWGAVFRPLFKHIGRFFRGSCPSTMAPLAHGIGGSEFPSLLEFIQSGRKGVVHCRTIDLVFRVYVYLWKCQAPGPHRLRRVKMYHSLRTAEDNQQILADLENDPHCQLVIATVAFSNGLNVKSLLDSISMGVPETVDKLCQDQGRVGRDPTTFARARCWPPEKQLGLPPSVKSKPRKKTAAAAEPVDPPSAKGKPKKKPVPMEPARAAVLTEKICYIAAFNRTYQNPPLEITILDCNAAGRPYPFTLALNTFGAELYSSERTRMRNSHRPRSSYFPTSIVDSIVTRLLLVDSMDSLATLIAPWLFREHTSCPCYRIVADLAENILNRRKAAKPGKKSTKKGTGNKQRSKKRAYQSSESEDDYSAEEELEETPVNDDEILLPPPSSPHPRPPPKGAVRLTQSRIQNVLRLPQKRPEKNYRLRRWLQQAIGHNTTLGDVESNGEGLDGSGASDGGGVEWMVQRRWKIQSCPSLSPQSLKNSAIFSLSKALVSTVEPVHCGVSHASAAPKIMKLLLLIHAQENFGLVSKLKEVSNIGRDGLPIEFIVPFTASLRKHPLHPLVAPFLSDIALNSNANILRKEHEPIIQHCLLEVWRALVCQQRMKIEEVSCIVQILRRQRKRWRHTLNISKTRPISPSGIAVAELNPPPKLLEEYNRVAQFNMCFGPFVRSCYGHFVPSARLQRGESTFSSPASMVSSLGTSDEAGVLDGGGVWSRTHGSPTGTLNVEGAFWDSVLESDSSYAMLRNRGGRELTANNREVEPPDESHAATSWSVGLFMMVACELREERAEGSLETAGP